MPDSGFNALAVRPIDALALLLNQFSKKPICHPTNSSYVEQGNLRA